MSLRSKPSLAILFASGLLGGTAVAVPYAPSTTTANTSATTTATTPTTAATSASQPTEAEGSTSALRTQTLTLPTNETATTSAGTTGTTAQNPVPPMGSPGSAGAAAADAAATANSATSESSLIEGLTSPLAAVTAPTGQTAAGSTSLKPIDLGGSDPLNLPQSAAVVVLSLAGLGLFGLSLVRYRNRQTQNPSKNEKPMQIISTLPLSPKRQLIMVRIRDQEIVLSSTEQGISMLTEVGGGTARNQSYPMLGETRRERDTTASRSHEIIQDTRETMARLMPARETEERIITEGKSGKSEMLLKALNGIKEKKSTRKTPAEEPTVAESKPAEPTKGAKAAFPKYLANAFQQEAKRELAKQRETPAGTEEDSVENVSRMIREKLKTMQPTGN